jgi:hypothetical protein
MEALGPEHVISVSHGGGDSSGVVTVWYWLDAEQYAEQERIRREQVEQAKLEFIPQAWLTRF